MSRFSAYPAELWNSVERTWDEHSFQLVWVRGAFEGMGLWCGHNVPVQLLLQGLCGRTGSLDSQAGIVVSRKHWESLSQFAANIPPNVWMPELLWPRLDDSDLTEEELATIFTCAILRKWFSVEQTPSLKVYVQSTADGRAAFRTEWYGLFGQPFLLENRIKGILIKLYQSFSLQHPTPSLPPTRKPLSEMTDEEKYLRPLNWIGSAGPCDIPAERIFGNDQGRTSERRSSNLE